MPASPLDSALYGALLGDAETATLFSDSAELRAMLLVEGALARAQGRLGIIPEISGEAIHRAAREVQLDPSALAAETAQSAVPVPALVKAFRAEMKAPEHAQFVHWGATSQDIQDTGLVLRLRQVLALTEARLVGAVQGLGVLAAAHRGLPMAARTWGQSATPTSFGAVVAGWGQPLIGHLEQLPGLRARLLRVSLAGAAGTAGALGERAGEVRAALAAELSLAAEPDPWHSDRSALAALSAWLTGVTGSLGKMGEDLIALAQSGIGEVRLSASGGSSTMPQKQNPVGPVLLSALATQGAILNGGMQQAVKHRQQRDGAAWLLEWMTLPQLCIMTARAASVAGEVARGLAPVPDAMAKGLDPDGLALIHAEALSFHLAARMPRPDAQAAVKALVAEAVGTGRSLRDLAAARWPGDDLSGLFDPARQLGEAPAQADRFAAAARVL